MIKKAFILVLGLWLTLICLILIDTYENYQINKQLKELKEDLKKTKKRQNIIHKTRHKELTL